MIHPFVGLLLYAGYLQPLQPVRVASGDLVAFKAPGGANAPQCQLVNRGSASVELSADRALDLISVAESAGSEKLSEWSFVLPESKLVLHCEFPRGATRVTVHAKVRAALAGAFAFRRVTAKNLGTPPL